MATLSKDALAKVAGYGRRSAAYGRQKFAEPKTLEQLRAAKGKYSDQTIAKYVAICEKLAADNGGSLPTMRWMTRNGHATTYRIMMSFPVAFQHIKREYTKKFGIYNQLNSAAVPVTAVKATRLSDVPAPSVVSGAQMILSPAKYHTIAEYNIPAAHFNPTELLIDPGLDENSWMNIGRALAHIGQAACWWIGDFMEYGTNTFGIKVTYDLAQQATGLGRGVLYYCLCTSRRFPPHRRRAELSHHHHKILRYFEVVLVDRLLAEAVEYGYSAKQIYEMALEAVGKPRDKKRRITIVLATDDYEKLNQIATNDLRHFIAWRVIPEWLKTEEKKQEEYERGRTDDATTLAANENCDH